MNFWVYLTALLYAVAVVKCFSFGVYGLKAGRGGTFAAALLLIAVSGVLFFKYLQLNP